MKLKLLILTLLSSLGSIAQISTFPYTEDFEASNGGWTTGGGLWQWGAPSGAVINTANTGVNAWVTNLTGAYTNNANETVVSPIFDFTSVTTPSIQFAMKSDIEFSWDGVALQSSIDGGATWQNVGAFGDPNWYNDNSINGSPGGSQEGFTGSGIGWMNVEHQLNGLGGLPSVQLRFAFGSDGSVTYEGFAFDDITIYNLTCPSPTALVGTYLAPDTLILNWMNGASETAWNIEYGTSGFTQGTGTTASFNTNPDTLTGISANTLYDFYIQADCGGGDLSTWQGPFQVSTLANDDACNAVWVPVDSTTVNYSNVGATTQVGEPGSTPNNTIWFKALVPASGHIAIATCGSDFDSELEVFDAGACSDFSSFTSLGNADWNPWSCAGSHPAGIELCGLTPGDTVTFWVGSWSNGNTGTFPLTVWEVSSNAGIGTLAEMCVADTVDLWQFISGNDDMSGVWSYPSNPSAVTGSQFIAGNSTFAGDTVYYIVNNTCDADTAAVPIDVYGLSQAGGDGSFTVCLNQPYDLYSGLSGTVDIGGTWYDPSNSPVNSQQNAPNIPGQFNYDYIVSNGFCPADTSNIVVTVSSGCDWLDVEELYFEGIEVYPNPATDNVFISNTGSEEVFSYEMTDAQGKSVASEEDVINGTKETVINLKNLETGLYLIKIYNESVSKTFRIVKQ